MRVSKHDQWTMASLSRREFATSVLIAAGLLEYSRGHLVDLKAMADGTTEAEWSQGHGKTIRRQFHWIVNATGFSSRLSAWASPLLQDLLKKGWIREDELGLGLETSSDLQLLDRQGAVVAGIHYVGPLLRAQMQQSGCEAPTRWLCWP